MSGRERSLKSVILFATLIWSVASASLAMSFAQGPTEYEVKAAFVYNFAKFVEWPAEVFAGPADSLRLCVLADAPVVSNLRQVASGKEVGGRSLEVRKLENLSIDHCHVVFVTRAGDRAELQQFLDAARDRSVLTVADMDGFLAQGGMINLVFDHDRIRFDINLQAAQKARLKLSSKLLNLAKSVQQ
jgi:hypothetical protein